MMLLPEIAQLADLTAVVDQETVDPAPPCPVIRIDELRLRRSEFDVVVCQIGNNIHHEFVWEEARAHPAVVVLHELVLHHLATEATLARGDAERFMALLRESDGIAGEAFARGRAAGHHFETGNFLFPASAALASSARALIVHNQWARARLWESGVRVPVRVIDHPLDHLKTSEQKDDPSRRLREENGFPAHSTVVGMFGFITAPKRPQVVFEAFSRAIRTDENLRLLVVGETAPNIDLSELARDYDVPEELWSSTGWTTDEEFDEALVGVDRVVSLRYPSAGESSGAIARVLAAGKPLAVSDYAQFAELPSEIVIRIPLGELEVERLARFMTAPFDLATIAEQQKRWIDTHGNPATVAGQYLEVLEKSVTAIPPAGRQSPLHRSGLGVLPLLDVESFSAEQNGTMVDLTATISNRGTTIVRSHQWGEPAYRLIVKLMRGGSELASEWWRLSGDLGPGESTVMSRQVRGRDADSIQFVHGLTGIPLFEEEPFFTGEVSDDPAGT